MNKLDAIKKKYEKARESRSALQADIDRLTGKKKELGEQASERAAAGDVNGYISKRESVQQINDELFVKQAQLEKTAHPVTEREVREAWIEYTSKADKELSAAWLDYEQKRQALADSYKSIMRMQEARLATRRQCAGYISDDSRTALQLASSFRCFLVKNSDALTDNQYYHRLGAINTEEVVRFSRLLSNASTTV